ncbi:MAG: ribonuclease III [Desulfobacteraceae bacterium]|jgi:ribonuclease-3|nr:MAG: ribonuclease III [Desulfobacteraceae bacterium]
MEGGIAENGIENLRAIIDYRFERLELLKQAFCHASYAHEYPDSAPGDNERLEFLGDAVLDLAVGHMLMELFPSAREGELSKLRAFLVSEAGLCRIARDLGLGEMLLLGKGEEASGGRDKPSILADTLEALIGALYMDAGFKKTMQVLRNVFKPLLDEISGERFVSDFKSLLQEHTQPIYKTLPQYHLLEESGPSHDKTFKVSVMLNGRILAQGTGKSKKEAEQQAAKEAYLCLMKD